MVSSITGNRLPADHKNHTPPLGYYLEKTTGNPKEKYYTASLNELGLIPFISTITGLSRSLLGIVHAISHLALAFFSEQKKEHLEEAVIGGKNICLGLGCVPKPFFYRFSSSFEPLFDLNDKGHIT